MPASHRPLSKIMTQKLRDCHEKQLKDDSNPCLEKDLKGSLAALYKRGLIDTNIRDINGKRQLCIIVTEAGVDYLKGLTEK